MQLPVVITELELLCLVMRTISQHMEQFFSDIHLQTASFQAA